MNTGNICLEIIQLFSSRVLSLLDHTIRMLKFQVQESYAKKFPQLEEHSKYLGHKLAYNFFITWPKL